MVTSIDQRVAHRALDRLVERSKRSSGLLLPATFARAEADKPSPLAGLIRGRNAGGLRLKLYLSTALLAGGSGHHSVLGSHVVANVSGAWWARTLNLPDPSHEGARRVAAAQDWLDRNGLLEVTRQPGREPVVRLRSADGRGREWNRPRSHYITVPLHLWTNRWIWMLSAKELAVLICLIDFIGGRGKAARRDGEHWMLPEERDRYVLAPDTWRLAELGLEARGLLRSDFRTAPSRDLETERRRKVFELCLDVMVEACPLSLKRLGSSSSALR